ncbi:MAG: hypothetical protein ACSHYA_20385 [Opitutaceae bacterium]
MKLISILSRIALALFMPLVSKAGDSPFDPAMLIGMLESGEISVGANTEDFPLIKPVELYETKEGDTTFQHSIYRRGETIVSVYFFGIEEEWTVFSASVRNTKTMKEKYYFCDQNLWARYVRAANSENQKP